jgi:hypothetical protein
MNNALGWMHALRREALTTCILAVIKGQRLTVTGMGRAIHSPAKEKHCIKRADRLLSNGALYREHRDVYHVFARLIVGTTPRPVIVVDWSDLDGCKQNFLLRAALALQGRTLTLYEEVHTALTNERPKTHNAFLHRLKALLPPECCPILITDAGFRTPWFKAVKKQGWDWVGRIRNHHLVKHADNSTWVDSKTYHHYASTIATHLGRVQLTRSAPLDCELVLYKDQSKGRVKKTKLGKRDRSSPSKKCAARESEPWLLATSLTVTADFAAHVVKIYKTRMQIEEGFRDNKSVRFGLGFELHHTNNARRLQILLLIASLATFVLWILGTIAKQSGQHWQYQANTVKDRNVLSVIYLGLRVAYDERFVLCERAITQAAETLWKMMAEHATPV